MNAEIEPLDELNDEALLERPLPRWIAASQMALTYAKGQACCPPYNQNRHPNHI